jgi:pilus assembly protein CpaF
MDAGGHRRVREIVGVSGRVEGDVIETSELFTVRRGGRLERADGYPPGVERYEAAGIDVLAALGPHRDRLAVAGDR